MVFVVSGMVVVFVVSGWLSNDRHSQIGSKLIGMLLVLILVNVYHR